MGEELKSPFIDTVSSMHRPKNILTSNKLNDHLQEFRDIKSLKNAFIKIDQEFQRHMPHHIQIPHGIIDGIFIKSTEVIIALCYEDYLLKYNIISNELTEIKLAQQIFSLCNSISDDSIFALGEDMIFIIDINDLEILKKVQFTNLVKCSAFSPNEILISNNIELFVLNFNNSNIKSTKIKLNNISHIEYKINKYLLLTDTEGITKYSPSFQLISSVQIPDIKLLRFSEKKSSIIVSINDRILILSEDLQIQRTIYTVNPIIDIFYQETSQAIVCCDSKGQVCINDLRAERRRIDIPVHSTQISKVFYRDKKIIALGTASKISTILFPRIHN